MLKRSQSVVDIFVKFTKFHERDQHQIVVVMIVSNTEIIKLDSTLCS